MPEEEQQPVDTVPSAMQQRPANIRGACGGSWQLQHEALVAHQRWDSGDFFGVQKDSKLESLLQLLPSPGYFSMRLPTWPRINDIQLDRISEVSQSATISSLNTLCQTVGFRYFGVWIPQSGCTCSISGSANQPECQIQLCCCHCLVAKLCPTLCEPKDCSLPSSYPWDFPGQNTAVGCRFLLPVTDPVSPEFPALAGGFFATEPLGKPCQMQLLWTKSGHTHLPTYAYGYLGSSSTAAELSS